MVSWILYSECFGVRIRAHIFKVGNVFNIYVSLSCCSTKQAYKQQIPKIKLNGSSTKFVFLRRYLYLKGRSPIKNSQSLSLLLLRRFHFLKLIAPLIQNLLWLWFDIVALREKEKNKPQNLTKCLNLRNLKGERFEQPPVPKEIHRTLIFIWCNFSKNKFFHALPC